MLFSRYNNSPQPPLHVMIFQLVSDFHTEFGAMSSSIEFPVFEKQSTATHLICAGDMGTPNKPKAYKVLFEWLQARSHEFEEVFVISGNHEFYQGQFDTTHELMAQLCHDAGVTYLNKTSMLLKPNIRLLGATLWFYTPPGRESDAERLTDFRAITLKVENTESSPSGSTRRITTADTNKIHEHELNWLTNELEDACKRDEKCLVVTHHVPCYFPGVSDPRFGEDESIGFCANSPKTAALLKPPVVVWACGHTHYSFDVHVRVSSESDGDISLCKGGCGDRDCGCVRLISNQLGYFVFGEKANFRPVVSFEI